MARFNTFDYDEGTLFGSGPNTGLYLWAVLIDWGDGNGFTSETSLLTDLTVSRGRNWFVDAGGNGWERFQPGTATITLDNSDGRFDPYNTTGALYPYVTPGKFCRLLFKEDVASSSTYKVFYGKISDIQPLEQGLQSSAVVTVTDGLQWLQNTKVKLGLREGSTFDAVAEELLTAVGFPTDEWPVSVLGAGQYTMAYSWFWNTPVKQALDELATAELGQYWHGNDGKMYFAGGSTTYESTVEIDESQLLTEIVIPQPWEVIRNDVTIYNYPKINDDVNTIIWQLQDAPAVANGATFTVDAIFKYLDYAPAGTNLTYAFTVNAAADGSGADLTTGCTLVIGAVGNGVTLALTNSSGTAGYITLLTVTGDAIYSAYTSTVNLEDTTSKGVYGSLSFTIDNTWVQDASYAAEYAAFVLALLKDPRKFPTIQIENRPDLQFGVDLFRTRIHLTAAALGIDAYFRVGHIDHKWLSQNGQAVRSTLKLEPYFTPFA